MCGNQRRHRSHVKGNERTSVIGDADGGFAGELLPQGLGQTSKPQKKIGRNAPCPCGSGKKYKRCCGK